MNSEFEKELDLLLHDGLKTNPLRIEYAEKVRELAVLRDRLLADGHSVETHQGSQRPAHGGWV